MKFVYNFLFKMNDNYRDFKKGNSTTSGGIAPLNP